MTVVLAFVSDSMVTPPELSVRAAVEEVKLTSLVLVGVPPEKLPDEFRLLPVLKLLVVPAPAFDTATPRNTAKATRRIRTGLLMAVLAFKNTRGPLENGRGFFIVENFVSALIHGMSVAVERCDVTIPTCVSSGTLAVRKSLLFPRETAKNVTSLVATGSWL